MFICANLPNYLLFVQTMDQPAFHHALGYSVPISDQLNRLKAQHNDDLKNYMACS